MRPGWDSWICFWSITVTFCARPLGVLGRREPVISTGASSVVDGCACTPAGTTNSAATSAATGFLRARPAVLRAFMSVPSVRRATVRFTSLVVSSRICVRDDHTLSALAGQRR